MKANSLKARLIVFGAILSAFMVLNFLIVNALAEDGPGHYTVVLKTTLATIAGPMTGAVARDFQDCCLKFSLAVMAFCAPVLFIGIMAQAFTLPGKSWVPPLQMALWILVWLIWFGGGLVSFGHALS